MKKLPDKRYLRVGEVAEYFDVSKVTVYRWIKEGRIIGVRLCESKPIRVLRDSVVGFEKEAIQRFWEE